MNRLDNLSENTLTTSIAQLETDLDQLKLVNQYVSGDSVIYFTSQTSATYDFSGLIPDPSGIGYGGKLFLITATAVNSPVLWGNVGIGIYADTPPVLYHPSDALADLAAGNDYFLSTFTDVPNNTVTNANVKQWYCQVNGSTTRQLAVKFWVEMLDNATVTVTALN